MSESNGADLTHTATLDSDDNTGMAALATDSPINVEYLPSSRGHRITNNRTEDGNASDASMPSLQTVSDSSDDDTDSESESESEWETDSDEDSDEDEEGDEALPALEPDGYATHILSSDSRRSPERDAIISAARRYRETIGRTPPPPLPDAGNRVDMSNLLGDHDTENRLNVFQRQIRTLVESFAAIANTGNTIPLPDDFGALQEIGNINWAQLFNPFTEVDDDPERAKTIMAKLEVVPKELVRRYEKLRGGVNEGQETRAKDVDGCAICREPFLEDEDEVVESLMAGEVMLDEVVPLNALSKKRSAEQSPLLRASSSSQNPRLSPSTNPTDNVEDSLRILAFPCPGMHLFHADCLAPWLARKTTCPSCRFDVDPHSLTLRLDRFASLSNAGASIDLFDHPLFTPQRPAPNPRRQTVNDEDRPPSPRGFWEPFFDIPRSQQTQTAGPSITRRDVEVDATQAQSAYSTDSLDERPVPTRPTRKQWKPPKGRDFKKWLEREESKKDGFDVDTQEDRESSESDDDDAPIPASPPAMGQGPQLLQNVVRQLFGQATEPQRMPPAPPPPMPPMTQPIPPAIPAIPPWEEGEYPGPNATAFVGARRAAAVGVAPRPSPLRFQTTVPEREDQSDDEEDDDNEDDDDASSMPDLGGPEEAEFQALMRALRGRGPALSNMSSDRVLGASHGSGMHDDEDDEDEDDEDQDDDELPPLIPDTIRRPVRFSSGPSNPNREQNVEEWPSRVPGLFQMGNSHSGRATGPVPPQRVEASTTPPGAPWSPMFLDNSYFPAYADVTTDSRSPGLDDMEEEI